MLKGPGLGFIRSGEELASSRQVMLRNWTKGLSITGKITVGVCVHAFLKAVCIGKSLGIGLIRSGEDLASIRQVWLGS